MSKQFWGVIVIVVLIFVGIFAFNNNGSSGGSNSSSNAKPSQHIEGKGQDGVTLVEYGDYQCPYCGQYYPVVKQVVAQYSNQITFQFRNFPLVSLHPNAFAGARAAEAASLQGQFWQMHDLLYDQNDIYYQTNGAESTWIGTTNPLTYFDQYAQQLGLNVAEFNKDFSSDQVNGTINADMAAGTKLGIDGTPTFFLDGKQISVGESATQFETLINAAIAKKTGQTTTSTTPTSAGNTAQTKTTTKSSSTTTSQ
jgi:protein-disulfide isomerase